MFFRVKTKKLRFGYLLGILIILFSLFLTTKNITGSATKNIFKIEFEKIIGKNIDTYSFSNEDTELIHIRKDLPGKIFESLREEPF